MTEKMVQDVCVAMVLLVYGVAALAVLWRVSK